MWIFTKHGFFSAVFPDRGPASTANPSIPTSSWSEPEFAPILSSEEAIP